MQAVILAGGKGRRLHPYTTEIPKPLVPLGEKTIVEILLRRMQKSGVDRVVVALNHLANQIENVLQDGKQLGLDIRYSKEEQELSTVAPLKLIDSLDDIFIVANGDILTDIDFQKLYDHHVKSKSQVTVAVHKRLNKIDYGVLETDSNGLVTSFKEKPVFDFLVSCGLYVFSRSVLDFVPDNKPFGFDDLMFKLLEQQVPINTYPFDGFWLDIGRPEDYEKALEVYQQFLND